MSFSPPTCAASLEFGMKALDGQMDDDSAQAGPEFRSQREATEAAAALSRKEKRKNLKKIKRKQIRQQIAGQIRLQEEMKQADPVEQLKMRMQEEAEAAALEKEKQELAHQEKLWAEREQKAREDAERKREEKLTKECDLLESGKVCDDDYVEGPPEIIWQGNEIIVKKSRVKAPESSSLHSNPDAEQPRSNPFPPQSVAFAAHLDQTTSKVSTLSYESLEQNPNFGTEQDKTHCPFHIKTGVCRFGMRCSRVHVYPEKSCTLLMKKMYAGPGLAWEHDEGLEYTDEEVDQHYEEFYEDVHSEFLKFGELVNFKVCRNVSAHLRGNVYVHYQSEDAAVTAFNAMNGRYFAGRQILCEFVGVTRWKVAICGEYMKAHHRPCSHGTACNFLHCFRNPGGEYDWADWDSPPPLYWQEKMEKLFGYRETDQNRDDRERKNGRYEYNKRLHKGYHKLHMQDDTSGSRDRRGHTYNRQDGRHSSRSSSDKHRHESKYLRDLNRQHHKKDHDTDSERSRGSHSGDRYDFQNHRVRSPESKQNSKRKFHTENNSKRARCSCSGDGYRCQNHRLNSRTSLKETYNHSGSDAEKPPILYGDDEHYSRSFKSSDMSKKSKASYCDDVQDHPTDRDSSSRHIKHRKNLVSDDAEHQIYDDSGSDRTG